MRAAALILVAFGQLWSAETVKIAGVAGRLSPSAEEESANVAGGRRRKAPATRRRQTSQRDGGIRGMDCFSVANGDAGTGILEMHKDCDENYNCGYAVFTLDTISGKTTKLYEVPGSKTNNIVLDACALHPNNNVIYCISQNYIVRFDQNKLHYVATVGARSTSATFDKDGTFYFEGSGYSGVYKVPDLSNEIGYEASGDTLKDHSDDSAISESMSGASDIIWTNADLGDGSGKQYLITLNYDWEVIVACVSSGCEGKMWTIKVEGDKGDKEPSNFGAGWTLGNRFFFADDGGAGLFEVSNVNLGEKKAWVSRVGEAGIQETGDGMSCSGATPPKAAATTTTEAPTTTTTEGRRRRRDRRRRSTTTEAPTTTAAPATPKGECPAGFEKKDACGCHEDVVRCKRM